VQVIALRIANESLTDVMKDARVVANKWDVPRQTRTN